MAPGIAEKKNNVLPLWGNEKTMNLNNLILTNILSSHYFKVNLYQLKTYHEVIDEIYYQVSHLEPWEKGSRKTSGQTGMCGGVRGVGAGGIVSTAFCILYKLFTLKLTRKQVVGLINHSDSPYIRALGFMYIRYTQPPADLWDWYEPYLNDEEELDVKAGSGQSMCIGEMLRHFLSKLEWFSTLFPRIPVPIQKDLEAKLTAWRSHPKNRAALRKSEYEEEQTNTMDDGWGDTSTRHRSVQDTDGEKRREYADDSREARVKLDVSEEIAREKDRQRKEIYSSSHRHSSDHHREHRHRSRSPTRGNASKVTSHEDEYRHHKKKHRKKERDHSPEDKRSRSHERSTHRKEHSINSHHSKDRIHNHEKRSERRQESSHSHSKKHDRHSHSHSHDRY